MARGSLWAMFPCPRQVIRPNFILLHHLRVKLILDGKHTKSVRNWNWKLESLPGLMIFHLYHEALLAAKR